MSTTHRSTRSSLPPVHRRCNLCGQSKTIHPINDEHRKAHLNKQLAFVCDECAGRIRLEVEAAGNMGSEPRVSA